MAPAKAGTAGKTDRNNGKNSSGRSVSLASHVAEIAVKCGLTLAQAIEHSLSQLNMLGEAADRLQCRQAIVDLDVVAAGVAASMAKNGNSIINQTRRVLKQRS